DGFASAVARFVGPQRVELSGGRATITLRRGRKVQVQFTLPEGMTWPKGAMPESYFDDMQERVRMMRQPSNRRGEVVSDFNMLSLREVGSGRFEFRLAEDTPRVHIAVHSPGFLQFFEAGPFSLANVKGENLEVEVPRPAGLNVSFEPGVPPGGETPFKGASLQVLRQLQGNSYLEVSSTSGTSPSPQLKLTDLAPGKYLVSVRTQPKEEIKPLPGTEINIGAYFDQRQPTLKAGQSERIEFRSTPYDPNAFRGKRTAVVKIRTSDHKPAQGRHASVTYFDGHYGTQVVYSGAVPASGDIELTGLTDKAQPSWFPYPAYTVSVDKKRLGSFGFADDPLTQPFEFFLAPGAGDMAPDLELTSLAGGNTLRLSDLRGKVVFLELWATWCGPCQQPMAKLNALGKEQRNAWRDRVVLLPVSIDSDQVKVRSHIQQRGWTGLEHFWSGGGGASDFDAPAARAFVASGVPEAVLISPAGRILWRGHPLENSGGNDLRARIEGALK
ncbi:TlpA family protein disulfide reductase, partial [Singulisphaera rosea]